MIKSIIISVVLASLFFVPGKQEINFGVYFRDNEIGQVKITKQKKDTITLYKVRSEVEYKSWLYDYTRISNIDASFSENGLVHSESKVFEDGNLEAHTRTIKEKMKTYKCSSQGDETYTLNKDIFISSAFLYFNEPGNASKMFSETYQQLFDLKAIEKNAYEVDFPGSKTNRYYYDNGKLERVEVERRWFTIVFKRKS